MSQVLRHPDRQAGATTEPSEAKASQSDHFTYAGRQNGDDFGRADQGETADQSRWTPFAIAAGVAVAGVLLALAIGETAARWLTLVVLAGAIAGGIASHLLRRQNARLHEDNRKAASEILRRT